MDERLTEQLLQYRKTTIGLEQLEQMLALAHADYDSFASEILSLEQDGVLEMVKANGRNCRTPSLAFRYRIRRSVLQAQHHEQISAHSRHFHPLIRLDAYYQLDPAEWQRDLPSIRLIDAYLRMHSLPKDEVPAPERSYELVQDEKWITDRHGKEVLERIGLWEQMKILPVADPLMLSVNPVALRHAVTSSSESRNSPMVKGTSSTPVLLHLIVENKTTYQGLQATLSDTPFATLIYGCGKKAISSIEQLDRQVGVPGARHVLYYFGDLDREGVAIWHALWHKVQARPALPFYRACLRYKYTEGKANQRMNEEAVQAFLSWFEPDEQRMMSDMFRNRGYYPQEVLHSHELRRIWRESSWSTT